MQILKADTATIVKIGVFVDVGDGFTPQVDIDLSADEAELLKHNVTSVVDISGNTWAAITDCRGWYNLTLTGGNLDTEGLLTVVVQDDSDCLPVYAHFMVVNANVYDSLYGTAAADYLQVDTLQIEGSDATTTLESAVDAGLDNAVPGTPTANSINERIKTLDDHDLVTKIPNTLSLTNINAEVDTALDTAVPTTPTSHSINERIKTIDDHDLVTKVPGVVATKTEMNTAHALLATPAQVNTEVDNALDTAVPSTPTSHSINERIKTLDDHDLVTKIPGVVTAVGATKAEMDAAHALLATPAQVNTQVDAALDTAIPTTPTSHSINERLKTLDDHDLVTKVPGVVATKSEMDAAHALLATPAQVNTQMVDVVGTDTISELSQGIPTATPTIKTAIMLIYMALRNKLTTTSSSLGIYSDDGTKIAKKALSDDGTTYTEDEAASGA